MPRYIFTYHHPEGYVPGTDGDAMAAWQSFFDGIASHIADTGQPVSDRRALGQGRRRHAAAVRLANGCPSLERGGACRWARSPRFRASRNGSASAPRNADPSRDSSSS